MKIVYLCDYHQNPTGLTLSAERRVRLLELAKRFSEKHRILVLEDAAYRELITAIEILSPTNTRGEAVTTRCRRAHPDELALELERVHPHRHGVARAAAGRGAVRVTSHRKTRARGN